MDTSKRVIERGNVGSYEPWVLPVIGAESANARTGSDGHGEPTKPVEVMCEELQVSLPTAEEIEKIRGDAEREGFDSGYKEGLAKAEKHTESKLSQLVCMLDQLAEPLKAVDSEVEDELARLAIDIAKQIVRRELRTAHGEVVAIVRQAVQALPLSDQEVVVSVNPEDASIIIDSIEGGQSNPKWMIQADPGVSRGGCRVTRGNSSVDGTVERRLAGISSAIFGEERRELKGG